MQPPSSDVCWLASSMNTIDFCIINVVIGVICTNLAIVNGGATFSVNGMVCGVYGFGFTTLMEIHRD